MSLFKKMLADASATFENDDEVENVIVIVAKKAKDGMIEQHTITNIAYPMGNMFVMMQEAAKQIVDEKKMRLSAAPAANES